MDKLRIVIAEKDAAFRKQLKEMLSVAGYIVIGEAEDGVAALRLISSEQPEVVLSSLDLAGSSGMELAKSVEESRLAAVILMLDYTEKDTVSKAGEHGAIPVLIKPFDHFNLLSLIEYSYASFNKMIGLEREVYKLKSGLEARKAVEKAKGILMKAYGLSEDDAFKRIQQQSMKKRTSMKNIAEAIITNYEITSQA